MSPVCSPSDKEGFVAHETEAFEEGEEVLDAPYLNETDFTAWTVLRGTDSAFVPDIS
jgi:hypothetical protein